MKTLFVLLVFMCFGVPCASAQSGTTSQQGRNLTCASDDGRRHYCQVNTSRGVRLVKQRSGSPCVQGQTWGYDQRGIWVDRGCRADFVIGAGNNYYPPPRPGTPPGGYYPPPSSATITCSSNNMNRVFCSFNTSRGVRLVNQRSGSPCVLGSTWGYTSKGIWVDRGCRADFAMGR